MRDERWSREGIPTWIPTLLMAQLPKQYSTPTLIPPAMYAGYLRVAITPLLLPTMSCHKWDHFEILAKRTVRHPFQDKGDWLLIRDLETSPKCKCQRWRTLPFLFACFFFNFISKFFYFMLSYVSLISCLSYIFQISVVIQRFNILLKMYVGTYETSS